MNTPDPYRRVSKRRFDGVLRAWRRYLHQWDNVTSSSAAQDGTEDFTAALAAEADDVEPAAWVFFGGWM